MKNSQIFFLVSNMYLLTGYIAKDGTFILLIGFSFSILSFISLGIESSIKKLETQISKSQQFNKMIEESKKHGRKR